MLLDFIFALTLLFGIVGSILEIDIPDHLIPALFGVALFSIAAFMKRRRSLG